MNIDILAWFFGIVVIFERASERLDGKDARLYSTDAVQARCVVSC